ncbi:MAG: SDR family NAD(P)-dependent oxidoreductase [Methylomonas sp.]|nr:SDR family NAD(P)-dependent oxidoreductase [Methylomonas sp.]
MKTILITGSNSAVGIAVAKALTTQPVRMALHYHSNQTKALGLEAWLDARAIPNKLFRYDLTQAAQAEQLIQNTLETFGAIDVLINVVGPYVYKDILQVTPKDWLDDIDLNLHTCFHTSHYALDALRQSRGHIVNFAFSGVENTKAWPMSAGYGAAKAGVVALSKSLAVALAPHQVRVNVICPGLVDDENIASEERQQMASQIPCGRPIKPDEIGSTVAWLISDSPETMTGTLLSVSGGWEY